MEQREDVALRAGLSYGRKEPGDGAGASQPFQPPGPVHTLELLLLPAQWGQTSQPAFLPQAHLVEMFGLSHFGIFQR